MSEKMRLQDRAMGSALSAGSALATRLKPLGKFIGGSEAPNYLPLRWHLCPVPVGSDFEWFEFQGSDSAGRTPSKYPDVALFTMASTPYAEVANSRIFRPAVAYALGETAMMIGTTLGNAELLAQPAIEVGYSLLAMRIGKGVLRANIGITTPDMHFVTRPELVITTERLSIKDVPASAIIV